MYCRSALLQLIHQCNSPAMETFSCGLSSTIAASAAVLQDLDIENLQLLSNELLAQPQPDGCLTATSLLTSQSPGACLASNTCSLSDLFYHDKKRLQQELQVAIARAAHQGEDYLIELTNQLCLCLQVCFLCLTLEYHSYEYPSVFSVFSPDFP
jgi:E3 ubiquitin-protein ligase HECTD4